MANEPSKMVKKPITRSMVRKATIATVRSAKESPRQLRLTEGQRKHITRSA